MEIQNQLLFFFSALGAFNGLVLGFFFLFFARPRHRSHHFLGALLIALSIRVGKSVFYYFYFDLADFYIQFGLFACWYIGPLLYFYVKSSLGIKEHRKNRVIHFSILTLMAILLFLSFPRSGNEQLWITVFIRIIYLQWIGYIMYSGYIIFQNKTLLTDRKESKKSFKLWFFSIYFGNAVVCLAFNTASYTSYIVGALSFTFIFYLLILLLLFTKKRNQLLLLNPPKYGEKKMDPSLTAKLAEQVQKLMLEEKLYLDPNMKLSLLSKKLQVNPTQLSQFLNEEMGISYSDFLNSWRVKSAQKAIVDKPNLSLEAIGYDCGFNSKSTFFAAFKKHAGMTPSTYRNRT